MIENIRSLQVRTRSSITERTDEDLTRTVAHLLGVKCFGKGPDKALEERMASMSMTQRLSEAGAITALLIDRQTGSNGIPEQPKDTSRANM